MTEKYAVVVSDDRQNEREGDLDFIKRSLNQNVEVFAALDTFAGAIHQANVDAGWWTDLETGEPKARNQGELLMLVVTEVAEAMEGVRKGIQDDHLKDEKMLDVELADVLIRLFDFIGGYDIPISRILGKKFMYNQNRLDHKIESRKAEGGKKV